MTSGLKGRGGSQTFRLANWGREQRSGSRGADHLLIHLTALCNTSHRCTLSDAGMAKYFELRKRSVSRHLAILRRAGLIASNFEGPGRSKRIITFRVPADRHHFAASPAPKWRSSQRQNGRQNHDKIESEASRLLPQGMRLRSPIIPHSATTEEAIAAYRAFREQASGEGGV